MERDKAGKKVRRWFGLASAAQGRAPSRRRAGRTWPVRHVKLYRPFGLGTCLGGACGRRGELSSQGLKRERL